MSNPTPPRPKPRPGELLREKRKPRPLPQPDPDYWLYLTDPKVSVRFIGLLIVILPIAIMLIAFWISQ